MKLTYFLSKLHNVEVTVELKNGTVIRGKITGCDASMNSHFSHVTMLVKGRENETGTISAGTDSKDTTNNPSGANKTSSSSGPQKLESLSVRGVNIRYILLPDDLDLDKALLEDGEVKLTKKAQIRAAERARLEAMGLKGGKGKGKGKGKGFGKKGKW